MTFKEEFEKEQQAFCEWCYEKWLEEHLKIALEKNKQYEELIIKSNA